MAEKDMKTVLVSIQGVSPLIMCAFPPDEVERFLIRGERPPKEVSVSLHDLAARKLYKNEAGEVVIPATTLFACLRDAGALVKYDTRRNITSSSTGTLLPSFLTLNDVEYPLPNDWKVDVRKGNLKDGTAIGIVRPRFDEWAFIATVTLDLEPPMTEETVKRLFQKAGTTKGLCAFRPSCGGIFGQFKVVEWEEIS